MKLPLVCFSVLCLGTTSNIVAQDSNAVIITINDSLYKISDFEKLYTKNLDIVTDENHKDIDTYKKLFIDYKLKLQKAYELKLHEKPKFKDEFLMHREQLAEKYFINEDRLKDLVEEALDRAAYEVNASHILVKVDEFASPADTLKAYKKALQIRKEIIQGLDFVEAAHKYSDDLSVKANHGNLGYFDVFRMVYPFETGAYNTPVGTVSHPVRSQFGYHLIKVLDKRNKPNPREISHIFISNQDGINDEELNRLAEEVLHKLKNGSDFGELALQYSDDQSSKFQQGMMGVFNENQLNIPNVGKHIYDLKEGEFTSAIKSDFGIHIFKVTKILPLPSREELKQSFERKVKNDMRSKILEKDLGKFLEKEYQVKVNQSTKTKAVQLITEDYIGNNNWYNQVKGKVSQPLFTYNNGEKSISGEEFLKWMNNNKRRFLNIHTAEAIGNYGFDAFQLDILKKEYGNSLDKRYPEFAEIIKEYNDGLLLFELLESEIFEKAKQDTIALQKHYETHKETYRIPARFTGKIYEFSNKKDAKKWYKILSKNQDALIADFDISKPKIYNRNFDSTGKNLPQKLSFNEIKDGVISKGDIHFVIVNPKIEESYIPTYEEVYKRVVSEYTQLYENEYLKQLQKNSKIAVENELFEELKNKYSHK